MPPSTAASLYWSRFLLYGSLWPPLPSSWVIDLTIPLPHPCSPPLMQISCSGILSPNYCSNPLPPVLRILEPWLEHLSLASFSRVQDRRRTGPLIVQIRSSAVQISAHRRCRVLGRVGTCSRIFRSPTHIPTIKPTAITTRLYQTYLWPCGGQSMTHDYCTASFSW